VLELDEALSSELVREREMVVEIEQPGAGRKVRSLGVPFKLSRTPGQHDRLPGPALGEHTEEALLAAGYSAAEVAELLAQGVVAGPAPSGAQAGAEDDGRVSAREVRARYEIPRNVLERLAEIGVLTPTRAGYDPNDVKIIEAIASFRAGGYEEALGFTVYDTLRYRQALEPLVAEEVSALLGRLAGEVDVERALEIVEAGVEPLRALLGAMHSKLLLAELRRQRPR